MERKQNMVTVVMPVYNCADYVEQAVISVMEQDTAAAIELLVVDDCSTDGTRECVENLILRYTNEKHANQRSITLIKNKSNQGVAETRNVGIREAKGSYIAFLDGDDWWTKDKLKKQLYLMEDTGSVMVFSGRELMHSDGSSSGRNIGVPQEATYQGLLHTNCIPCSSVLLQTQVAREFYMCHDDLHEDYIMWLEILKKYGTARGINEPLLKSRLAEGGKSRNKWKSAKMHFGVYRYMKIPIWKSLWYFLCYGVNGIKKYKGSERK